MTKNQLTTTSPSLPALETSDETDRLVNRMFRGIWREAGPGSTPMLDKLPNAIERDAMIVRARELVTLARPIAESMADRERVQKSLVEWFIGYPAMKNVNGMVYAAGYLNDLLPLPALAIVQALADIKHNRVPDLDLDYVPTSPRIYAVAEPYAEKLRAKLYEINTVLSIRHVVPAPPSPEEQAKVQSLLANTVKRLDASLDLPPDSFEAMERAHLAKVRDDRIRRDKEWTQRQYKAGYAELGVPYNPNMSPELYLQLNPDMAAKIKAQREQSDRSGDGQ